MRIVLINSDYYDGSSSRTVKDFVLQGLSCVTLHVTRLTAASAMSRQDHGSMPTFGGKSFSNQTCRMQGQPMRERLDISQGLARLRLAASEAVMIDLNV